MDPRTLGLGVAANPILEADYGAGAVRPAGVAFDIGAMETIVIADTQPPTVVFQTPGTNAYVRQTVTVAVQADDPGTGVATVALTAASQTLPPTLTPTPPAQSLTATAAWNTIGVSDGAQTLTATTMDGAGHTATATRIVVVDNTPPDTAITTGPSASITETSATFVFTGSDNLTPVENLEFSWRLDGLGFSTFSAATSVMLSGLGAGTHTFDVKARDRAGNEDLTAASATFTVTPLGVTIAEPLAGATVEAGLLFVRGTFDAGGQPAGIAVNGVTAAIQGTAWFAQLPVSEATTTLTAVVTTVGSVTASASITIVVTPPSGTSRPILRAVPASGSAALAVRFSILGISSVSSVALDADGNGTIDVQGPTLEGYTFTYGQPGVYVATAGVVDGSGNVTQTRAIIQVFDRTQLDALLQGAWLALRSALQQGNVDAAVALFAKSSQDAYRDQFSALEMAGALPQVAAGLGPITLSRVLDGTVEYDLRAVRDQVQYSFLVVFVIDEDGVWRLWAF